MIIACPDCSGPYELPDDQIAALVQVECPHCQYRIILDFEAANDSSLVEAGMKMASGYASEADFRAAASPAARAAPSGPAVAPTPKPTPTTPPPRAPAPAPPAATPASGPVRSPAPVDRPEKAEPAPPDTGRTILGQPPISIPPVPPGQRAETPKPLELTQKLAEDEAPEPARVPAAEITPAPAEPEEVEAEPAAEAEAEARPEPAARKPPHTPPAKAASAPPPAEEIEEEEAPSPAELSAASMSSPDVMPEPSSHGTLYLLVGLLLILGVLVGFSYYDTGNPDPMPLIEELIRSYTG